MRNIASAVLKYFNLGLIVKMVDYYAVARGRKPGIYYNWDKCKEQVHGYSNASFKKFNSRMKAEEFIKQNSCVTSSSAACNSKIRQRPYDLNNDGPPKKVYKRTKLIDLPRPVPKVNSIDKDSFSIDDNGYVNVYTDGACTSNGRKNAQAGIGVWFGDNHPLNVSQPVLGRQTNNMAEIRAVTVAAEKALAAGVTKLKINTDSQFLINCITKWIKGWKRNNWKTSSGKDVINKLELLELEEALKPLQVSWNYVKAHKGIHGNEMADKLARLGASNNERCQ
ncbi:ribonuclease H1 isoform X1 [Prorops nasuta]|uniref:ribonuclease H1 isoform X1 n=1 Tax=Prorops nasuta TaxID=863751 RepID=UPI0034CEF3E2